MYKSELEVGKLVQVRLDYKSRPLRGQVGVIQTFFRQPSGWTAVKVYLPNLPCDPVHPWDQHVRTLTAPSLLAYSGTGPSGSLYQAKFPCRNCGQLIKAEIPKGVSVLNWRNQNQDCPYCGCSSISKRELLHA